jgi:uncharacterized protein YcbK (DUF882 family)
MIARLGTWKKKTPHPLLLCCAVMLVLQISGAYGRSAFANGSRFFYSGNGWIHLTDEKSGTEFRGRYRKDTGNYDPSALRQICSVFGAPYDSHKTGMSLRLIEFLDFLEDRHRQGASLTITSGYRNPTYNSTLRKQGRLAAKASLHQYGMAADLIMQGVPSKRIWLDVQALGFGGTGYYQGKTVHIDVGPARSWDQTTSGVGTGISDDNKLIGLVTDFDIYRSGEPIVLRFIRMTAFPIGVKPEFVIESVGRSDLPATLFTPSFVIDVASACPAFQSIEQMDAIRWRIPSKIAPGRYRIRAGFCENPYPDMPVEVWTPEFEISAGRP